MAKKKEIKQSEARILLYLSQVPNVRKSLTIISTKLDIDYAYCNKILASMIIKGWVFKHRYNHKVFYDLTANAPLDKAELAKVRGD